MKCSRKSCNVWDTQKKSDVTFFGEVIQGTCFSFWDLMYEHCIYETYETIEIVTINIKTTQLQATLRLAATRGRGSKEELHEL